MQVGDRYGSWTARERLGSGGGGEVWLADHDDGRVGALKVLAPNSSREDRARFVREIRTLEKLDHPAIVRLLDSGFAEGAQPWLVMEYVDGEDLEQRLARGEKLAPEVCLSLFAVLTDGLAHAHERGIQHRDVKASNVILRPDGRITLVDFGASIEDDATGVTKAGLVLGTFAYMPPEVLTGGQRDPISGDVYAIGQLLVEALTGVSWFRGSADGKTSWHDVVAEKLRYDSLDPGPEFPDRLRRVIRDATAIEPEDRGTMPGLRDTLEAILTGTYATPAPARRSDERVPLPAASAWGARTAPAPKAAPVGAVGTPAQPKPASTAPPASIPPAVWIGVALVAALASGALVSLLR